MLKKKLKSAFVATVICATFLSSSEAFAATILFTNPDTTNSSFNRSAV
ncbi:hypothetical protein [Paenibacillus assamensis]|nr:hypothetical protein [Paenibacillus assamensis]